MTPTDLEQKYRRLQEIIRELESVAVAFSAGVDSTLLVKVAVDTLGLGKVVAVTGDSSSLARSELEESRALAEEIGVEHVILTTDELDREDYASNPKNRCYHCKSVLFARVSRFIAERGLRAAVHGANVDDRGDYRPGAQAAEEHNVRAPLAEAGLTKADLRILSKQLGLATSDKPASPCLASRIPYGERVTRQKLAMIEAAEAHVRKLGFRECRVRHHSSVARIEVPKDMISKLTVPDVAADLDEHFRSLGFSYVTVDLRGFRSGNLNETESVSV